MQSESGGGPIGDLFTKPAALPDETIYLLLGRKLFQNVEAVQCICIMSHSRADCIDRKPTCVELERSSMLVRQSQPGGVLEHLIAQTAGKLRDDHMRSQVGARRPL